MPINIGYEHFAERLMLLLNVQWDIYNKQVSQAIT